MSTRIQLRSRLRRTKPPPSNLQPADPSVLSVFPTAAAPSLTWYRHWLQLQASRALAILELVDVNPTTPGKSPFLKDSNTTKLFLEFARKLETGQPNTIEELSKSDHYEAVRQGALLDTATLQSATFSILGWQSMIWDAPLQLRSPTFLSIKDPIQSCTNQRILRTIQPLEDARLPLHQFLLGFGPILPSRPQTTTWGVASSSVNNYGKTVSPEDLNWSLLDRLGSVTIRWVDYFPQHLVFDSVNHVLYVFRYPSFIARHLGEITEDHDPTVRGILSGSVCTGVNSTRRKLTLISSMCAPTDDATGWPAAAELDQFLREILTSYRLIFSGTKSSRKASRSLQPFKGLPKLMRDPFLAEICSRRSLDVSMWIEEKTAYSVDDDFPILRNQILELQQFLDQHKARGWRQIWRSRQRTEQWYAFWAILIIGIIGIVLSLIQTILQAIQVALAFKAL